MTFFGTADQRRDPLHAPRSPSDRRPGRFQTCAAGVAYDRARGAPPVRRRHCSARKRRRPDLQRSEESMKFQMQIVPPPEKAPIQSLAAELGLCNGLQAEQRDSQSRCSCCAQMMPKGSWLVWVPDSIRRGDPSWAVTEAARENAFNGHWSGWCLDCARLLSGHTKSPKRHPRSPEPRQQSWLAKLWGRVA